VPAALLGEMLETSDDQGGPSGLMTRTEAATGLGVEVLMKIDQTAPMWIASETQVAKKRAAATFA
jgi:hypothetical protein